MDTFANLYTKRLVNDIANQLTTFPVRNPTKLDIIFVTHGPSPWDPEWIVREEQFGR